MNNLVSVKNKQVITNSRQVAKVFGKQPNKINHRIAKLIKTLRGRNNIPTVKQWFKKQSIIKNHNHAINYLMNKDGFMLVVMGFRGKRALKFKVAYIKQFDYMQTKLNYLYKKPGTFLNQIAKQVITVLNQYSPKWHYYLDHRPTRHYHLNKSKRKNNKLTKSKSKYQSHTLRKYHQYIHTPLVTISKLAKEYGYQGSELNALLGKYHFIKSEVKNGHVRWHLTKPYQHKGLAFHGMYLERGKYVSYTPVLHYTKKGVITIANLLNRHGIVPKRKKSKRVNKMKKLIE